MTKGDENQDVRLVEKHTQQPACRRPYVKPAFERDRAFEVLALQCVSIQAMRPPRPGPFARPTWC